MSTITYWAGRLRDEFPLYDAALRKPKITYKPYLNEPYRRWPRAVCRSDLYHDYVSWYNNEVKPVYQAMPVYQENPQAIPPADAEFIFFATMSPWLYVMGKKRQVKSYYVDQQEHVDGSWVNTKVRRYFIRLGSYQEHLDAFESITGLKVSQVVPLDIDRADKMARQKIERVAAQ